MLALLLIPSPGHAQFATPPRPQEDYLNAAGFGLSYGVANQRDANFWGWSIEFSRRFGHGWKFNFGPGTERKIEKNKNLFLFRLQGGYDWHSGHWSWGPQLTVDLIEDGNSTIDVGFSAGYGW